MVNEESFCILLIVDYPMFEKDVNKIVFSHNPFSMPQVMVKSRFSNPLDMKAYQYDIICKLNFPQEQSEITSQSSCTNYFQYQDMKKA